MTRADRYEQIRPLRDGEGLTWAQIGERLGISLKTAFDVYSDPDGSKKRRRQLESNDRLKEPCPRCGKPKSHRSEYCQPCFAEIIKAGHRCKVEDAAEMYREGMSMKEIALAFGYGPNSKPPEVAEARRLGLITSYRYKAYERKRAA